MSGCLVIGTGGWHIGVCRDEVAPRCGATRKQECLRHNETQHVTLVTPEAGDVAR